MTTHQGEILGAIIAAAVVGALIAGCIYRNHCEDVTKQDEESDVEIGTYRYPTRRAPDLPRHDPP